MSFTKTANTFNFFFKTKKKKSYLNQQTEMVISIKKKGRKIGRKEKHTKILETHYVILLRWSPQRLREVFNLSQAYKNTAVVISRVRLHLDI